MNDASVPLLMTIGKDVARSSVAVQFGEFEEELFDGDRGLRRPRTMGVPAGIVS